MKICEFKDSCKAYNPKGIFCEREYKRCFDWKRLYDQKRLKQDGK